MTPEECEALKRAFQRKRLKRTTSMVTPLTLTVKIVDPSAVPPLVPSDLPIIPPPVLVSIEEEVAQLIAQTHAR